MAKVIEFLKRNHSWLLPFALACNLLRFPLKWLEASNYTVNVFYILVIILTVAAIIGFVASEIDARKKKEKRKRG